MTGGEASANINAFFLQLTFHWQVLSCLKCTINHFEKATNLSDSLVVPLTKRIQLGFYYIHNHRFKFSFFFQIESDEDVLWKENIRETKEEVAARGAKFMNWLIPCLTYFTRG